MAQNFDRQYRLAAAPPGGTGFECGGTEPYALHISFSVQKTDSETENTAKFQLWNLSPSQLATLNEKDCVVTLKAGYNTMIPLVFVGAVSYVETEIDGADRLTTIEAVDGRIELRDTWLSLSYSGSINAKKLINDIAAEMSIVVVYSYNAKFEDIANGFSYVGKAGGALDKVCASSNLAWSIQNGILQVKLPHDTISQEVFLLTPDTGLINIPKKVTLSAEGDADTNQQGWDVEYLMNAAIGIDDLVRLESEKVQGNFRVYSVEIAGDNLEGSWTCMARLLEV